MLYEFRYLLAYLVRSLECPTIDAVVGGIYVALREPGNVAILKATRAHGVERAIPVKSLPSHLRMRRYLRFTEQDRKCWLHTFAHHLSAAGPTVSA